MEQGVSGGEGGEVVSRVAKSGHSLTLTFATAEEKEWVWGQLTDGFGENHLAFVFAERVEDARHTTIPCAPDGEIWEHHQRLRKKHPEWFDK
jgi:hypothetical protein